MVIYEEGPNDVDEDVVPPIAVVTFDGLKRQDRSPDRTFKRRQVQMMAIGTLYHVIEREV